MRGAPPAAAAAAAVDTVAVTGRRAFRPSSVGSSNGILMKWGAVPRAQLPPAASTSNVTVLSPCEPPSTSFTRALQPETPENSGLMSELLTFSPNLALCSVIVTSRTSPWSIASTSVVASLPVPKLMEVFTSGTSPS